MRRLLAVLGLVMVVMACRTPSNAPATPTFPSTATALLPTPSATQPPTAAPTRTATPAPTGTPTAAPTATWTATATAIPSATPTALPPTATWTATPTTTPTPLPDDLWIGPSDLQLHPDGDRFFSGDLISFEVQAHHGYDWTSSRAPDVDMEVWLGLPGAGQVIAQDRINFNGRQEGEDSLPWVWDTAGLVGPQTVSVLLDPDDEIQTGDSDLEDNLITHTLELYPRAALPDVWAAAEWRQRESACCVFHYISGTAAERDIQSVMDLADGAIDYAAHRLGEPPDQVRLEVYLIDRVLGHGGFANEEMIISYLDRFYPGGDLDLVFRHEGVHVLDRRFADVRVALLTEGLAVYISGGHFREEPLAQRAAALLALDRYIPLSELADSFYPSQHEIGYLEGAAFISFLVDRFGWPAFKTFYGDIERREGGQAAMLDVALQEHFDLNLSQAEADWLASLRALPPSPDQVADLRLTIQFYDTLRRYQQAWDPSAYFREVWLPPIQASTERGITADWMRHPSDLVNVTLETMFTAADRALDEAAYDRVEALLTALNATLDAAGDLRAHPLTDQYRKLVQVTARAGYEAQQIELDLERDTAHVLAAPRHTAQVTELTFQKRAGTWRLLSTN